MQIDQQRDVLIVVDMQNDHVTGTLEHPGASTLIGPINRLAEAFDHIVVVKDWHPIDHVSFAASHAELTGEVRGFVKTHYGDQFAAAPHCVQGTWGAELDPGLKLDKAELEFRKGYRSDTDSYSAFHMNDGTPTGFAEILQKRGFSRVFGVGVGKYGCVAWSLKGAVQEGFEAFIIEDGCKQDWGFRASTPEQEEALSVAAAKDLTAAGVGSVYSEALLA